MSSVVFDPLLPWMAWGALAGIAALAVALALWRGLAGWMWRGFAAALILMALAGPSLRTEDRGTLSDIVVMLVDGSASQGLATRPAQMQTAADAMEARLRARPNTEVRRVDVGDGPDDSGTLVMSKLAEVLAEEPESRIAGIVALTDGQIHDAERAPDLPAPLHVLLSGQPEDWDRRLIVETAPAFAILGEPITLKLQIQDMGAAPSGVTHTPMDVSIDGVEMGPFSVPVGQPIELPLTLEHGGMNVIRFSLPLAEGELTDRNNSAVIQINGVRDRLRVLLVSGEPHPGGRTWRNLLKSDSSVDLVHFTILRPPEKQDGVPVGELSLIAFPTRELFLEKIDDFDLIIFDRYKRRGILPSIYLENVKNYIEKGGAVLIAAGPDFASADSIFRSPLSSVIPARPSARVIDQGYRPAVTDLGQRHPVTAGLAPKGEGDWGRWLRQIEVEPVAGSTVMSGVEDKPLLVLNRVGEGRVALLASDQAWLWDRGFEGGGPQLELLRRLAHWMMKEPELEEEALWAEPVGQTMKIVRRTLADTVAPVTVTTPTGETVDLTLSETSPGRFEADYTGPDIGLYHLANGDKMAVIGLGPSAPKEFEATIADASALMPAVEAMRGGVMPVSAGLPSVRDVRAGRPASGRGWIGLTPRNAYETLAVTQVPLLPAWLVLLMVLGLTLIGWLREGRR
ncbi:hypothetical protein E7681_10575 [Thalassobius vesicularis]|uniref:Glutamine amidotransferase domain-containing protein n=1 Tax=Thalassobius vesicularis TaxID=1294297 RepID=A0A4S3M8W4_9RHOB|nr:glutamine amidotransferase [Thalassobius vesicularis]THD74041.1 hypothetical protein E7681_10575 [Thalassobius vesicularis]